MKLPEKKKKKKVKKLGKGDFYDAVDIPFNAYIRNRDGNRCVQCGTTDNIQCGHVIPKNNHLNIRWDEENAYAQCGYHNKKHHYDSVPYNKWLMNRFPGRYETLCLRAETLQTDSMDYRGIFMYWVMRCISIHFDIISFILNSTSRIYKIKKVFPDIISAWKEGKHNER